jgi:thymidylate synthase (FAD)
VYGVDRSESHEEIRHQHRIYSQVSQRYVDASRRRYVERPETQEDVALHQHFEDVIDRNAQEHDWLVLQYQTAQENGSRILSAGSRTDRRKKVQQAARGVLPNQTETAFVVTGSVRAWRQYIEARANEHAEIVIRWTAFAIYLCLVEAEPILFNDYTVVELPDGTKAVSTPYPKI